MSETFINRYPSGGNKSQKILAGKSERIDTYGSVLFVEKASADFEFQLDNGPRQAARQNLQLNFSPDIFQTLRIFNLSATEDLFIVIWTGRAGVTFGEYVLPPVDLDGEDVDLNYGDELILPGVDSTGRRRKQITITMRRALKGFVTVYNNVTDKLVAIIAASDSGGGFAIEADSGLRVVNRCLNLGGDAGINITSDGDDPDIAIASTWYK